MAAITQLAPYGIPGRRYSFTAKTESTGVALGQGGNFISISTTQSMIPLRETPVCININSTPTVVKI